MDIEIKIHDLAMLVVGSGRTKSDSAEDFAVNYLDAASKIEKILSENQKKVNDENQEKMIERMENSHK
jgi:hypothetical protein